MIAFNDLFMLKLAPSKQNLQVLKNLEAMPYVKDHHV